MVFGIKCYIIVAQANVNNSTSETNRRTAWELSTESVGSWTVATQGVTLF